MAGDLQPAGACAPESSGKAGRKAPVRWSEAVAARLLARLAAGEFLYRVCKDPGMPTAEGVAKWGKERPEFGEALRAARAAGGRPAGSRGPVSTYCEGIAEEIFRRVCEGEALTRIGEDPTMPCVWTIFRWRREFGAFEDLMQLGMRIRAERFVDRACDLADEATPETAYLTHVRLTHLRWSAGTMAPRVFRTRQVEPETPAKKQNWLIRTFRSEPDPETGRERVVCYCPNPFTGEMEREDTPGWVQAGGPETISLPGGRLGGEGY